MRNLNKIHISTTIDKEFYQQVRDYCRIHQMSISSLIGEALACKINKEWQMEVLEKCERLIEAKLPPQAIEIRAKKLL